MKIGQELTMWFSALFVGASLYGLNFVYPIIKVNNLPETGGISYSLEINNVTDNTVLVSDNIEIIPTLVPTKIPLQAPFTVQLIGDSMMLEGFGPRMEFKLSEYVGITIKRFGKYSTGLNRVDYYNWYTQTSTILDTNKPDVLIVMFGGNDGQSIQNLDTGVKVSQSTAQWDELYRSRVKRYLDEFAPRVKEFYWVGHPIPRTEEFNKKFSRMNAVYLAECAKVSNCHFVDEWSRFAVNGKYSVTVADDRGLVKTVKGGDGIHVNTHGGNIMAELVIKIMKEDILMQRR